MTDVIIIGAGPSGIAAAKWLMSRGFEPRIYESHSALGGQWCWTNPNSGVWPQMVTNTFLEATRFSDLAYPEGTPLFPHNATVRTYFEDFARAFGITERIRFNAKLTDLVRDSGEWRLTIQTGEGEITDRSAHVVIATGRFNDPVIPSIPGEESFSGKLGLIHSFNYKDPLAYQEMRVVVLGGSISSLEIASDLAMLGTQSVHLAQRRQRYVNPKMYLGTPIEYRLFTHERGRLALEDKESLLRDSEAKIMEHAGDPSRYGTPKPHPDFAKAGATGSQHYLNLVAEGRVKPVGWPDRIDGQTLYFEDGSALEVDGIVAGTGFRLSLPFLGPEIANTVRLTEKSIDLDEFTFHPDLPGLAFMGLWSQAGSYPTPIEQQARFLAYTWSGEIPRSVNQMRAGVTACVEDGHHAGDRTQSEMALRFARLCGTDPGCEGSGIPADLVRSSATTGTLYRMVGPDASPGAEAEVAAQNARFLGSPVT